MKVKFDKKSDVLVVSISGELDHHTAAPLREAIDSKIMETSVRKLLIDLSGMELMDSSGIGVIMGRYRLMDSLGGAVCVSGASPSIGRIIELSGLTKLICLCKNVEEGISLLKGGIKNEK